MGLTELTIAATAIVLVVLVIQNLLIFPRKLGELFCLALSVVVVIYGSIVIFSYYSNEWILPYNLMLGSYESYGIRYIDPGKAVMLLGLDAVALAYRLFIYWLDSLKS